jgi:hypothetical protein
MYLRIVRSLLDILHAAFCPYFVFIRVFVWLLIEFNQIFTKRLEVLQKRTVLRHCSRKTPSFLKLTQSNDKRHICRSLPY